MSTLLVTSLQAAPAGSGWSSLLMIGALFVVMYFFMIRPQQKRQKELNKFRNSIQKGDKVLTSGGIYGIVKNVEDMLVTLEIAPNVNIKIDKFMIMRDPSDMVK